MKALLTNIEQLIKAIIALFVQFNGTTFVGLTYTNKNGETAKHVINVGFSYANAVKKDLAKLQGTNIENLSKAINFPIDLVQTAVNKMIDSFVKNQNEETQSNQSKAQQDLYIHVPGVTGVKINKETKKIHIYAMAIHKEIIVKGEYKEVNSRELTLCQNAIKKHLNFTTAKYRNFIINPDQLHELNANKLNLVMA